MLFALGRRYKRVYFALHAFVLMAWSAMVALLPEVETPAEWVHAFRAQWIPGEFILGALVVYYTTLTVLFFRSGAFGEDVGEADAPKSLRGWDL